MAQSRLADMLHRTGAPEAEQLGALTDAIKAFSASVGPTRSADHRPPSRRLAHVALAAQAVEIAVDRGHAGDRRPAVARRGRDAAPPAGSTPRWRWPPRRAAPPAAPGAAERALRFTEAAGGDDADRRRALAAWRSLGRPSRVPITEELVARSSSARRPSLVVELRRTSPPDGRRWTSTTTGSRPKPCAPCASESPRRRSPGARRRAASRSSAAPATAPPCASTQGVEVLLDAARLGRHARRDRRRADRWRRRARAGRNDPCPCGSGRKYKRCCGATKPRSAADLGGVVRC